MYNLVVESGWTRKNKGFVVLIGPAIRIVFGIIAYVGQSNLSLFLMRVYHESPCPKYAIIPNTISLAGLYWKHKPLVGRNRLGEDREKVEFGTIF